MHRIDSTPSAFITDIDSDTPEENVDQLINDLNNNSECDTLELQGDRFGSSIKIISLALRLKHLIITDEDHANNLDVLIAAIKSNPRYESLSLCDRDINDADAVKLSELPNLTQLDLSSNPIGIVGVKAIANSKIRNFIFQNVYPTEEMMVSLATSTSLLHLDLGSNVPPDRTHYQTVAAFATNTSLRFFNCPNIADYPKVQTQIAENIERHSHFFLLTLTLLLSHMKRDEELYKLPLDIIFIIIAELASGMGHSQKHIQQTAAQLNNKILYPTLMHETFFKVSDEGQQLFVELNKKATKPCP